ncbi:MAG: cell division protein FtsQ/DivIB [Chitinophagaceae bacterium]|nr:cell division protein FtsQ/DivIB [Chitinophagaceae bacterium]
MAPSKKIRKILVIGFWLIISAGVIVLLVAAVKGKQQKTCSGFEIQINGDDQQLFVDKAMISKVVLSKGTVTGKPMDQFDLKAIEELLKKNVWIAKADLFFDNSQKLQVRIVERQPIARVFTGLGNSFFIDSSLTKLPIGEKFPVKLPVFTGFPGEKNKWTASDSLVLNGMKQITGYLEKHPFWAAQVAQIDINSAHEFELIPTLGNHVIELGDGSDVDSKFNRLWQFYTQVLTKTGLNYYERVKVQYLGQVVGVKTASAASKADSIQAIRNVEQLIRDVQLEHERMISADSTQAVPVQQN